MFMHIDKSYMLMLVKGVMNIDDVDWCLCA